MLITNGILVTQDGEQRILTGQALRVHGGRITDIGRQSELIGRFPDAEQLDARG